MKKVILAALGMLLSHLLLQMAIIKQRKSMLLTRTMLPKEYLLRQVKNYIKLLSLIVTDFLKPHTAA